MPIYSYRCENCGHTFECLVGVISDTKDAVCPKCGNKNTAKKISGFSVGSSSDTPSSGGSCSAGGGCCPA